MKNKIYMVIALILMFLISVSNTYAVTQPETGIPANSSFDDYNFYKCVINTYNSKNRTSYIATEYSLTDQQLASITSLYCGEISSTKGLEKITGLTYLQLQNNQITDLDLSNNTELLEINISSNKNLKNINLTNNVNLVYAYLDSNSLESIDVSNNTLLKTISLGYNKLVDINLNNNSELRELYMNNTDITSINLSNNSELRLLELSNNKLTELDISNNLNLYSLNISGNDIDVLDVSNNPNLVSIEISEDTEVIGASADAYIKSNDLYLFSKEYGVSYEDMFTNNIHEFTIHVSNSIDKIAVASDSDKKGYHYDCPSNVLCGSRSYLYQFLYFDYDGRPIISVNGVGVEKSIERIRREIYDMSYEQCEENTYPCLVYQDGELYGRIDSEEYPTEYITFYKNGEEWGKINLQHGDPFQGKAYMIIGDLNVGNNVLTLEYGDVYTINIIREDVELDNNPSEELDEIIDIIVNNNDGNSENKDKMNDIIMESPNTGLILSISLSVVSVILISLMYYKYYKKKKVSN